MSDHPRSDLGEHGICSDRQEDFIHEEDLPPAGWTEKRDIVVFPTFMGISQDGKESLLEESGSGGREHQAEEPEQEKGEAFLISAPDDLTIMDSWSAENDDGDLAPSVPSVDLEVRNVPDPENGGKGNRKMPDERKIQSDEDFFDVPGTETDLSVDVSQPDLWETVPSVEFVDAFPEESPGESVTENETEISVHREEVAEVPLPEKKIAWNTPPEEMLEEMPQGEAIGKEVDDNLFRQRRDPDKEDVQQDIVGEESKEVGDIPKQWEDPRENSDRLESVIARKGQKDLLDDLENGGFLNPADRRFLESDIKASAKEKPHVLAVERGYVSSDDMLRILARRNGWEYVEPGDLGKRIDIKLLKDYIDVWSTFSAVPLEDGRIATGDLSKSGRIENGLMQAGILGKKGKKKWIVADQSEVDNVLKETYAIVPNDVLKTTLRFESFHERGNDLLDEIILSAYRRSASDIHFDPMPSFVRVLYRIHGELEIVGNISIETYRTLFQAIKTKSKVVSHHERKSADGSFIQDLKGGGSVQVRLSVIPTIHNKLSSVVLRLLNTKTFVMKMKDLGFHEKDVSILINRIRMTPSGIVVMTGPTGAGKNTTLNAITMELDLVRKNLVEFGDPIEYRRMYGVQSEVWKVGEEGWGYTDGMRAVLRHDPDIVMLGEIRDEVSARMVVQEAKTGHLVMTTLHASRAFEVFERLRDFEIPFSDLVSGLKIIISQRLLRRLCKKCSFSTGVTADDMEGPLGGSIRRLGIEQLWHPKIGSDCPTCSGRGYLGQFAVPEILVMNPDLRMFMMENRDLAGIVMEQKYRDGNHGWNPLLDKGLLFAASGEVSVEEVISRIGLD